MDLQRSRSMDHFLCVTFFLVIAVPMFGTVVQS